MNMNISNRIFQSALSRKGKFPWAMLILGLVLLIGLLDYETGYEAHFFLFYFFPVALASWSVNRRYGIVIAVTSTIIWALADILAGQSYSVWGYQIWNSMIHLGAFLFVALALARIAEDFKTQRRLYGDLSKEKARIEQLNNALINDMETARLVQRTMVSQNTPTLAGLDVAVVYHPASLVGGDLLNIYPITEQKTLFFMGDAMGHGVQAALVMSAVNVLVRRAVQDNPDPAAVLEGLNKALSEDFNGNYVTGVCCLIDTSAGTITLSVAGHPRPVRTNDVALEEVGRTELILGVQKEVHYHNSTVPLASGDVLVLYTDGLVEAQGEGNELYGCPRLEGQINQYHAQAAQEIAEHLVSDVLSYCGSSSLQDDLSLLVIKVIPAGKSGR